MSELSPHSPEKPSQEELEQTLLSAMPGQTLEFRCGSDSAWKMELMLVSNGVAISSGEDLIFGTSFMDGDRHLKLLGSLSEPGEKIYESFKGSDGKRVLAMEILEFDEFQQQHKQYLHRGEVVPNQPLAFLIESDPNGDHGMLFTTPKLQQISAT